MSSRVRWAVGLLGLLLVLSTVLVLKITSHASQELARAEAAGRRGAYQEAVTHYARAIKWYTPGSAAVRQAVEQLWQLATEAETRADWSLALEAYQALRSSLYAVQSVYIPYRSWIPRSEERIAPLLARMKAGAEPPADTLVADTARFTEHLQRPVGPRLGWSLLAEAGFLGWIGATLGLIWRVVDAQGRLVPRQGLLWGGLLALCLALWLVGMRLA